MGMYATYSPEDNKCRLYADGRLGSDTYEKVKAAGFKWAPKQELFVAPAWTPEREDLLLELCGEIGDEDTSLVERAEERAERFEEYSDKRGAEAHAAKAAVDAIADNIPTGQPLLVGHHSYRRALKDKEKIENGMRRAVNLWKTSKYWTDRAAGALRHAKYKELPGVRARRIKTLEADKRKHERAVKEREACLRVWEKELTIEQARLVAGRTMAGHLRVCEAEGRSYGWSAYDVLKPDGERYAECPAFTVEAVREVARRVYPANIEHHNRWIAHLDNRLAYEKAMLAESGGTVADKNKPEKGGACRCWASPGYGKGYSYIKKVNKVSVTVEDNFGTGGKNFTRTIPFDKLKAVMSKAAVDEARAAGRLTETADKTGFYLRDAEPPPAPTPKAEPEATPFDKLEEALAAGVKVVSAPSLFPTPPDLAARVVELAEIEPGMTVLEPSAGTGNLVRAAQAAGGHVQAVEINWALCSALAALESDSLAVMCSDFLECGETLGRFDRIVMNPPFENAADIKHVEHARTFLKPGGRLVSIVANGPRQREKLMPLAAEWIDLPAGSFAESGTNVNAAIIVIEG